MRADDHEAAFEAALDALAADPDISAAEYQEILGNAEYSIQTARRASIEEHGDLT